jgi:uncharacterized protein YbaR (Trm112 family)
MTLDPELPAMLVCPVTRGPLRYDAAREELVSEAAGLAYPVRDGVPVMLAEEARPLSSKPRPSS